MIETKTKEDRRQFYQSSEWRKLRKEILERDHYECQWCKEEGKVVTVANSILEVDHIRELESHPDLALNPDNLRILCKTCHNKRHERFQFRSHSEKSPKNFREDEWWGDPPA